MTCLLAYSYFASKPTPLRYALVFMAYLLALLAKPMAVTLPFVLLLFDFWPLCRWPGDLRGTGRPARLSVLIMEKAPLLLPVPLMSLLTMSA